MPTKTSGTGRPRRRKTKKQQPALKGFLLLLVVLISLTIIAFAATFVYVRLNKPSKMSVSVEQAAPVVPDTIAAEASPAPVTGPQKVEQVKKQEYEPALMGTWVSNSSSAMITFEGNRYTLDMPSVEETQVIKGSFSIESGVIILKTGEGPKSCSNATGRYTYQLKGDDLTLRMQSDACKIRSNQLQSSFFRMY